MQTWSYLVNPFEQATFDSFTAMMKIAGYTMDAINSKTLPPPGHSPSDPPTAEMIFFTGLKNELQPFADDFSRRYTVWQAQFGERKFRSTKLAENLQILSGIKIAEWDMEIRRVYKRGSAEYDRLMPKFRWPFQKGSQMNRLSAVQTLSEQVSNDSNLPAALKTDVADFLTKLENDFHKNLGERGEQGTKSSDLESSRKKLAVCLYGILSSLMRYYREEPERVANFFDFELLRRHEQTIFRHKVKAGASQLVVKRNLSEDTELRLVNDGSTALEFYFAMEEDEEAPAEGSIIIAAKHDKKILAKTIGGADKRNLIVRNMSEQLEGHYIVELR